MTTADKLIDETPVRLMIAGYPGTGKTGALACLVNIGYKLRVLDFDGNLEPLYAYTKPEMLKNIDVLSFEDKLRGGQKSIEVAGIPTAFSNALRAMDHWKYTDPDTEKEVDLGYSKDWGSDTILLLDSLTTMGVAAKRRTMSMMNKTPLNATRNVWGAAMEDQNAFCEKLTSRKNRFHVIVTAHLKKIGPKDIEAKDDPLTKELKERVAEVVPTRLFPAALGQALSPEIGGHFPTLVLCETEFRGSKVRRVIRTVPRPEMDLKVPAVNLPDTLPLEDGLLQIFTALKAKGVNNG